MQRQGDQSAGSTTGVQTSYWSALFQPLSDFLSAESHSTDFTNTRGWLIRERIRPLALILVIFLPLWIPLEFYPKFVIFRPQNPRIASNLGG